MAGRGAEEGRRKPPGSRANARPRPEARSRAPKVAAVERREASGPRRSASRLTSAKNLGASYGAPLPRVLARREEKNDDAPTSLNLGGWRLPWSFPSPAAEKVARLRKVKSAQLDCVRSGGHTDSLSAGRPQHPTITQNEKLGCLKFDAQKNHLVLNAGNAVRSGEREMDRDAWLRNAPHHEER